MAVTYSRSGGTLTVTVTQDVADIVSATGLSAAEKRTQALRRCDAEIDAEAAAAVGPPDRKPVTPSGAGGA